MTLIEQVFQKVYHGAYPLYRQPAPQELARLRKVVDFAMRRFAKAAKRVPFPQAAREELSRFTLLAGAILMPESYPAAAAAKYGIPTELLVPLPAEQNTANLISMLAPTLSAKQHKALGRPPVLILKDFFRALETGKLGASKVSPASRGVARIVYHTKDVPVEKLFGGAENYGYRVTHISGPHAAKALLKRGAKQGNIYTVKLDSLKQIEEVLAGVQDKGVEQVVLGDHRNLRGFFTISRLKADPEAVSRWLADPKSVDQVFSERIPIVERVKQPQNVKYLVPDDLGKAISKRAERLKPFLEELPKPAKFFGAAAALYGIYSLYKSLTGETKGWLNATTIGYRGKDLLIRLGILQRDDIPPSRRAAIDAGTAVHGLVEQSLLASGKAIGAEVAVQDKRLGIHGSIDVLLKGNIPLELKVVSGDAVNTLSAPHEAHASQVNFYAYSIGAPFGVIRYIDRDDPNHYREFRIPYSPGRLISDVEAVASTILQYREWVPKRYVSWAIGRRAEAGIRDPEGPMQSFQSMRASKAFPHGRTISTDQVAIPQGPLRRMPWPKVQDSPLRMWALRQGHGIRDQKSRGWLR